MTPNYLTLLAGLPSVGSPHTHAIPTAVAKLKGDWRVYRVKRGYKITKR